MVILFCWRMLFLPTRRLKGPPWLSTVGEFGVVKAPGASANSSILMLLLLGMEGEFGTVRCCSLLEIFTFAGVVGLELFKPTLV